MIRLKTFKVCIDSIVIVFMAQLLHLKSILFFNTFNLVYISAHMLVCNFYFILVLLFDRLTKTVTRGIYNFSCILMAVECLYVEMRVPALRIGGGGHGAVHFQR